jgi:hypothetical protein
MWLAAGALVLISAVGPVASAHARTLVVHQPGTPQATLTVPTGWRAETRGRYVRVVGRRARVAVRVCPLDRAERDMTGRHFTALWGEAPRISRDLWGADGVYLIPVAGGGCLVISGVGARAVASRLHARLGPPTPPPPSDIKAEDLARRARARTLSQARAAGTAFAVPFHYTTRVTSQWEWDLPAHYSHQIQRLPAVPAFNDEIVQDTRGDHLLRSPATCWTGTQPPDEDDALEPRLELQEWGVPPKSASAWRIAYTPAEPQPDGSISVRWTGFVADGDALIGPDGLLRSVRIVDHHQAVGRTVWREVGVDFTSFPTAIAPVTPTPQCP